MHLVSTLKSKKRKGTEISKIRWHPSILRKDELTKIEKYPFRQTDEKGISILIEIF